MQNHTIYLSHWISKLLRIYIYIYNSLNFDWTTKYNNNLVTNPPPPEVEIFRKPTAVHESRYRINNSIASFVTKLGGHYIKYPDICRNYTFLNQMEFILHQLEMTYFWIFCKVWSNVSGLTFTTHKAFKHYWIWSLKWCTSLFKGLNN